MSRRPALAALGAALLAVLATGCSGVAPGATGFGGGRSPQCSSRGFAGSNTVVLMAQAVPSATQLPCIRLLPAGWTFGGADVARGVGRFWLNNDRAGLRSVQVSLTAGCDVSGLRPVPSDEEGTDRYERIQSLQGGYAGERLYVFPGGCATYRFRLAGPLRAAPLNEASLALGFVSRAALRATVNEAYRGHAELDPPAGGGR